MATLTATEFYDAYGTGRLPQNAMIRFHGDDRGRFAWVHDKDTYEILHGPWRVTEVAEPVWKTFEPATWSDEERAERVAYDVRRMPEIAAHLASSTTSS